MEAKKYEYDFFVIGGGSGGLAAAKEAAKYGVKVGLADFVKPTPIGTKWGLGGTCVNVGCIPKIMMHYAANLYSQKKFFPLVGYPEELKEGHNWNTMVENVQNHIYSLNFGYKTELRSNKVTYHNKFATFKDEHTIELTDAKGNKTEVTADKILVAVGLRPNYPNIPGAKECCITSDDLFSYSKPLGKVLVIGASYISLECASFLRELGYSVTVMVRSILLRGFDRDMAERLGNVLERKEIKFYMKTIPLSFSKQENGEILVQYQNTETLNKGEEKFDTVLLAIGRTPCTNNINIENAKVNLAKSGKIIVDAKDQSNIPNIYAIGDCSEGRPELTPPAIYAGKVLARRLFNNEDIIVDYENIPTTVFAAIEYSTCGLTEEEAKEKYGCNIVVYHSEFTPVNWTYDSCNEDTCYIKVIVNKADNNKVIGIHILAPHAGEICQGFSVAMKCGLTKDKLDTCIGIHPTIAEEFTTLDAIKGESTGKKGGC
ncbi:MAG: FAD-dependent oxidoreductase [archaeon]|nr:FAD-dependent oxidoreductase [archaeon]